MKNPISIIAAVALLIGILVVAVWWEVYKYHDCKKVGHSMLYCIGRIDS